MDERALADADAMVRSAEKMLAQQQADADRLNEALSALTIIGSNDDESVRVKINSTGGLADIKFTEAALRLGPDQLRREVMRGITTAQTHLAEQVHRTVSKIYGPGTATAKMFADQYEAKFGVPETDENEENRA